MLYSMKFDVVRKKFEININIKRWYYKKKISVKYEQASMYEINEFLYESQRDWFRILDWIVDFVENNSDKKLNVFDRRILSLKFEEIFETLKETYFKWAFNEWGNGEEQVDDLLASYIVFLSWELKQDPLYLMKNYTIEQLKFFTDWIVRNNNERTDEWKRKNRLKKIWAKNEKISKDSVQSLLSQLNENKCNEASKSK